MARRRKYPKPAEMTPEARQALMSFQDGRCAICRQPHKLVIDPDHRTSEVRGLLCSHCNTGLGFFEDDIRSLEAAVDYLIRPSITDLPKPKTALC
jgi:hypothetical protein